MAGHATGHKTGHDRRSPGFWLLASFFSLFVLFMYGPMLVIFALSFQGPEGGLTFPMRGFSLHWYQELVKGLGVVDIAAALRRSLTLGIAVMLATVLLSVLAGLAFRKRLVGASVLFFVVVASLIMPSIIVSLGIGLEFRLLDGIIQWGLGRLGAEETLANYGTAMGGSTHPPWGPISPGPSLSGCSSCLRCSTASIQPTKRPRAIWVRRPGRASGMWFCR